MRKLWFGGTFNPIHHGHLLCAREAAEKLGYEQVVLVPSGKPPHKPHDANLAAPVDRLSMTRLAVADDPLFAVSDIEIQQTAPSYTLYTARQLRSSGEGPIHWLIGADMLMTLPTWHKALELLEEVRFVILARPNWILDWQSLPTAFQSLASQVVEVPQISISATDIRRRVASGQSIRYLTPPAVCQYIRERNLYR